MRPQPVLEDEPGVSSAFVPPMYFTAPSQLLDLLTEMEESNLFLIQHGQARTFWLPIVLVLPGSRLRCPCSYLQLLCCVDGV